MGDLVNDINDFILKSKVYLKPGQKPPKGYQAMRGRKGGYYYEAGGAKQMTPEKQEKVHSSVRRMQGQSTPLDSFINKFGKEEVVDRIKGVCERFDAKTTIHPGNYDRYLTRAVVLGFKGEKDKAIRNMKEYYNRMYKTENSKLGYAPNQPYDGLRQLMDEASKELS